eukprot:1699610-Amphidinium_carterae.1
MKQKQRTTNTKVLFWCLGVREGFVAPMLLIPASCSLKYACQHGPRSPSTLSRGKMHTGTPHRPPDGASVRTITLAWQSLALKKTTR